MKKILSVFFILLTVPFVTGAGYVGTLPNVDAEFSYLRKEASEKASAPFGVEELDRQNAEKLKPVPRGNSDYVDIIVKKDKTSQYENDINSIIVILEKLRRCLNTDQSIQIFNATVSNLIDHIDYLRTEYADKPESNYLSYKKLMELSPKAANTARFRTKAQAVAAYMPYSSPDNIYTKENIQIKLDELLKDVTDTVFILKNLE